MNNPQTEYPLYNKNKVEFSTLFIFGFVTFAIGFLMCHIMYAGISKRLENRIDTMLSNNKIEKQNGSK